MQKALQKFVNMPSSLVDLSMENTFHAFLTLKGKRLTGSFGSMHGLKIEKAVPDEISKDDLPYLELLYRFVFGERSYYDLSSTRHVEPRAMSEEEWEEETTDRHDRSSDRATGDTSSVVCDDVP